MGDCDDNSVQALQNHVESSLSDWQVRLKLSGILGIPIFVIVWPQDHPFVSREIENAVRFYELKNDLRLKQIQKGDVDTLRSFIKQYRAGYSPGTVKGLNSAYTKMECYLAHNTGDPWPGNLDGALMHENKVVALFEFKTHNLDSPIGEEDLNKYQRQNGTRFFALGILQSHLSRMQGKPKYLLIHWGPSHRQVKVQSVDLKRVEDERLLSIGENIMSRPTQFAEGVLAYLGIR